MSAHRPGGGGSSQEASTTRRMVLGKVAQPLEIPQKVPEDDGVSSRQLRQCQHLTVSFPRPRHSSSSRSTRAEIRHAPHFLNTPGGTLSGTKWEGREGYTTAPSSEPCFPLSHHIQQLLGRPCPLYPSLLSVTGATHRATHTHTHTSQAQPSPYPMCPLQSCGSSRARQSLRSLSTGPGPPGTGSARLPLAPAGAGLGARGHCKEMAGRLALRPLPPWVLKIPAPARLWAPGSGIKGLDAEQGHKGAGAEWTGGAEVGVARRPASHDLLIIHQGVTGTAQ